MAHFLFYNGEWLDHQQPLITAGNRGFRYGDGLFETLCVVNGGIRLARYHFERLWAGMQLLQLQLPPEYSPAYFSAQIAALCQKNQHPAARVRLTVFRGDGALFDPANSPAHCIIESQPLPSHLPAVALAKEGLITGIYSPARKSPDGFSNIKSNNYLPSVMASLHARQHGWNDAFLLNTDGRVCESAIANVFIARGRHLYTPPLSEGCVAGVMRRFLLEHLPAAGYTVDETPLSISDLYAADEVFLTNALHLLRSVSHCDKEQYHTQLGAEIYQAMEKKWADIACFSG